MKSFFAITEFYTVWPTEPRNSQRAWLLLNRSKAQPRAARRAM